ncbi:hypothetical protein B7486_54040, partial [cyanobacterium TDX16]
MGQGHGRVLAIGLDSIDEEDLLARLAAGQMPNLAALRDRGTWASLSVDERCRSELPWLSLVTGLEAEALGQWTAAWFDPATYEYGSHGAPDRQPFWSLAGDQPSVSLDVAGSTLARGAGTHVVDWFTHDPMHVRCSSPPDVLVDLDRRFGPNPARLLEYAGTWHDAAWVERHRAACITSVDQRTEVVEHLLATTPGWRLGVVSFGEAHELAHHAWHGVAPESIAHDAPAAAAAGRALDELHVALDAAVGRLTAGLEPNDVVVVFAPKGSETHSDVGTNVLGPELLHRAAFGEALLAQPDVDAWQRAGQPALLVPRGSDYVAEMRTRRGERRRGIDALRAAAHRTMSRLVPERVERRRARRDAPLPWSPPDPEDVGPVRGTLLYDEWLVSTWYRPWWPRMRAFAIPSFSDLHVRINVEGRERDGVVPVAEYEQACDEVESLFRACSSLRTGRPAISAVDRPRGADPFLEVGLDADVVLTWAEDLDGLVHPDVGPVGPYPAWRTSGHAARGFALFAGGDVGHGRVEGPRVVDVPATLLDLAGVEPATPIDGTPIALVRRVPA